MIRGIHHLAIATLDIKRTSAFYVDLFGCEVISDWGWQVGTDVADQITALHDCSAHSVMLRKGNAYIELFEYASPEPGPGDPARRVCDPGLTHLCFDVTDLDAEYERLVAAGMTFHCPPQLVAPNVRTTYGRDPDGNVVELQEVLDETHRVAVPWLPGRGLAGE
ncbi:VOC family protein [Amycolatopsis sp. NBC_01480]|uniref:VOC family protein n=1 Tax=Amycolatopsis sp. NBC_01480 TaxID=2903562 RepID=UPI002E2E81FB|nr:VOC family protein [Amycolatopsis sp. NBC_01480]